MEKYDINGLNVNKKNFKKINKIEKIIYSNPKLEQLKKDNYRLYPLEIGTLVTSISSGVLTNSVESKFQMPLVLLSGGMILLSIGIGTIIIHNTKLINKLIKERNLKIEEHRKIK